ncbi:hypothetical protein ACVNP3_17400 [Pseudomonas chlororaphis subsp. piscium]
MFFPGWFPNFKQDRLQRFYRAAQLIVVIDGQLVNPDWHVPARTVNTAKVPLNLLITCKNGFPKGFLETHKKP